MIVVLSLSIWIFLAWPRSARADVLEVDAEGLEDWLAAGQDGDILEHGLAAIAVAGSLHRGAPEGASRSLLMTRVARASPSMSSAMIRRGLPVWATFSRTGTMSLTDEIFFS